MKITEFSLRNPIVVVAVAVLLACYGVYAYLSLGIGITPNVSFPLVVVSTTYPGADPATVETQVTKPIEDAVATLPNVDSISSTSNQGISTVNVQFTTAAPTALVAIDVERAINSARNLLPVSADLPTITKLEISAFPVITVALSGPQSLGDINAVATDRIQRVFESVPGVQSVSVTGGRTREVHINVNPAKLQAYSIGLNTVQLALQNEQLALPAGTLSANGLDAAVRLSALAPQPADLGNIIVAYSSRGPIYLRDVASIDDSTKAADVIDRVNGVPAVSLQVTKLATSNTLEVSQGIRNAIAQLQPDLPQGMKMDVVVDAASYTQQSFNTIRKTLLEAVIFTGLILLLFLHTWRSTLVVLVAIPTSVLTTLGLMYLLGLDLDLFSMLALTLSVGILVDDSIVVLENIFRHLAAGEHPVIAAANGRSEIGLAAITITLVDVVVYIPIALISGIAGDFIRPFALVVAAATITSLAVSFTLTPLLASRFLDLQQVLQSGHGIPSRFGRQWDAGFSRIAGTYQWLLRTVLTKRILNVPARWYVILAGVAAFMLGLTPILTGNIGFDIFPSGDQSEVDLTLTMPPATSLATSDQVARGIEDKLRRMIDVRTVYVQVGSSANGFSTPGGNVAQVLVLLVAPSQRTESASAIADRMGASLDPHIAGARLEANLPNAFGFGGFGVQPIQIFVRGPDPAVLDQLVNQMTQTVESVAGTTAVNNSNQQVQPEYLFTYDRGKAADLGVTAQDASSTLRTAVNGTVVAKYQQAGQADVDIRLQMDPLFLADPKYLTSLPVQTSGGSVITLGQLGNVATSSVPVQILHNDRERSVTINASVTGRLVGSVQNDVAAEIAKVPLPPGYSIQYGGQAAMGGSAFLDIFKALGLAVLLIYLLMLMLFGSVTLPLAVLMSQPLAVIGAFTAMALTGTPFTLFSLLGFALLIGLVGKNAILLVDYTDTLRKRGHSRTDALLIAGPTRLRPIVMTTMSILVSLMPLIIGLEAGSELLKASAVVLIGGLVTSTLLTLVFVPAMYTVFDDVQEVALRLVHSFARPRAFAADELALLRRSPINSVNGVYHGDTDVSQSVPRSAIEE